MYRVIIWGTGECYNRFFNMVKLQEVMGNVKVVAVISDDRYIKNYIDGYPFVRKDEVASIEFDFCLVAMDNFHAAVTEADDLRIPTEKLIPMRVLAIPYFDFERYMSIKSKNITIFSCACWGGCCYHYLGLKFLSPTINLFFTPSEFNRFLARLDYYLSLPVQFEGMQYEPYIKRDYPVGRLEDVRLHFNHYRDFEQAQDCWERRKKRINMDNLFCVSYTTSEADARVFDKLPYKNKLIFIPENLVMEDTASICHIYCREGESFGVTANRTSDGRSSILNILKLLNHEKDFLRMR